MKSFYQFCEEKLKEQYASANVIQPNYLPQRAGKPLSTTINPKLQLNTAQQTTQELAAAQAAKTAAQAAENLEKVQKAKAEADKKTTDTRNLQTTREISTTMKDLQDKFSTLVQSLGVITPQGTGSQPVK